MAEASSSDAPGAADPYKSINYDAITDGQKDIAMTSLGDKMKVEAPGRVPLQHCWLWIGSDEGVTAGGKKRFSTTLTTNRQYKPIEDGPNVEGNDSLGPLPTGAELDSHASAVEYLEVGLVIGDEPDRYKVRGASRSKAMDNARANRGDAARDSSAIRAFIPATEHVSPHGAKYYVGVRAVNGRYFPRVIAADSIYFYPEFWHNIPLTAPKETKKTQLNNAAKYHAASVKSAAERAIAAVTPNELARWATSNPLVVTQAENLANTLVLLFTAFEETGDRGYIHGMVKAMEDAAPDLKVGPYTANEGVKGFHNFEDELSDNDAQELVCELKHTHPAMPDLNIAVIQAVHHIIIHEDWAARLPFSGIAFFLELCHENIASAAFDEKVITGEVDRALTTVKLHVKHKLGRTTSDSEPISKDNYRLVLTCIKEYIESVENYIQDSAKALADQHGGILKHGSIKDIMTKLGNSIDVVTLQSHWEQLAALHAVQHTASNDQALANLHKLKELIEKVLAAHK